MNMRIKLLIVFVSLLLSMAVAPTVLAGGKNNASMDMNDRIAIEKGASGRLISKVDDGELGFHLVAKGLPADTDLEVHVVVTIGWDVGFVPDHFHAFPTKSDNNGKLRFDIKGFDLDLDEGKYRLDFVVIRPGGTDFLLACEPAPLITIDG